MQRRKYLAALGSLAAGGAAAMGTGAFDQVSAERQISISVPDDNQAYLTLDPSGSPFASLNGDGEVVVDISGNGEGGAGINPNGTTLLLDVFEVRNQGTDPVIAYVNPDSVKIDGTRVATLDSNSDDYIDPQGSGLPHGSGSFKDSVPRGYDALSLTAVYIPADGNEQVNAPKFKQEADTVFSSGNGAQEFRLNVGQSYNFGLYIKENGSGTFSNASMELVADTNIVE
jgi:hypothetical protein